MVRIISDFLQQKFVLPRRSIDVQPAGAAFRHIALPSWAAADKNPGVVYRRLLDGTIETGLFTRMVDDCYAEYVFGDPEPLWYSYAPWFVGTFEEVSERMAQIEAEKFGYFAFATATRQPASKGQRGKFNVRCMCVYPVGRNLSAEEQEERFHILSGFLQEAADFSDARLYDTIDYPNLIAGLNAVGEGAAVMNEVAALAFKLEFSENYKTTKRYELQV